MKLDKSFAHQIMDSLWDELAGRITVTDPKGYILASSEHLASKQIDDFARQIVEEKRDYGYKQLKRGGKLAIPFSYKWQLPGVLVMEGDVKAYSKNQALIKKLLENELRELLLTESLTYDDRAKDRFITNLLLGAQVEWDVILKQAELLDIDLENRELVFLLRFNKQLRDCLKADGGGQRGNVERKDSQLAQIKQRIKLALDTAFSAYGDHLIAYLGGGTFADLVNVKDCSLSVGRAIKMVREKQDRLIKVMKENLPDNMDVTLGLGNQAVSINGLRGAFEEARTALRLGLRIWGANRLYFINDLGVAGILGEVSEHVREKYIHNIIEPILDQPELLHTLRVYFDSNLNLSKASEHLYIHRNTLIYRLDKITEEVGLDPRIFEHAIQIQMALLLNSLGDQE